MALGDQISSDVHNDTIDRNISDEKLGGGPGNDIKAVNSGQTKFWVNQVTSGPGDFLSRVSF